MKITLSWFRLKLQVYVFRYDMDLVNPQVYHATGISQNKVYQVNLDWGVLYNQFMFQTSNWVYIYYPSEHLCIWQWPKKTSTLDIDHWMDMFFSSWMYPTHLIFLNLIPHGLMTRWNPCVLGGLLLGLGQIGVFQTRGTADLFIAWVYYPSFFHVFLGKHGKPRDFFRYAGNAWETSRSTEKFCCFCWWFHLVVGLGRLIRCGAQLPSGQCDHDIPQLYVITRLQ